MRPSLVSPLALALGLFLAVPAAYAEHSARAATLGARIDSCIADAQRAFGEQLDQHPHPNQLTVLSWPQTWPNSNLGFPGGGLQALTTAQTVVVVYRGRARVYHGKRFAYQLDRPSPAFWAAVQNHRLPGAKEPRVELSLHPNP